MAFVEMGSSLMKGIHLTSVAFIEVAFIRGPFIMFTHIMKASSIGRDCLQLCQIVAKNVETR